MTKMLHGLVGTPVTPFTSDNQLDHDGIRKVVNFLIDVQRCDSLAMPMHVGENLNMSAVERMALAGTAVEATAGRVPIYIKTSLSGTDEVIALSKHAESVGADGVVVIAPYHWRPSPEATYQHFKAVADAINIGLVAYNFPERVGVTLTMDLLGRLLDECPNFVGLKDASFNFQYFTRVCALAAEHEGRFNVFTGIEYVLPGMVLGGSGCFSPNGEIAPNLVRSLFEASRDLDIEKARGLQQQLDRLYALLEDEYPSSIKTAMAIMGRPVGDPRLPLLTLNAEARDQLEKALGDLGILGSEPHGW